MKGLRLVIPPFAPDQSGAAGVFCMLPGLIVILDAGGCAGNICGFDEPRWFGSRSAIFSAGLRDMDAILGRDDKLVEKIAKACEKIRASFVAVIGTPVPAVIATDYRAVGRMIRKKTGLPVMMVNTDGTAGYDEGEKKAWMELARLAAEESGRNANGAPAEESGKPAETGKDAVGILGMTPLSFHRAFTGEELESIKAGVQQREGCDSVYIYTAADGMETAALVRKNLVVSPSAIPAAESLKEKFGTPYEIWCDPEWILPLGNLLQEAAEQPPKRVLTVHQQVLANQIRNVVRDRTGASVDVASWFGMDSSLKEPGDRLLREEEEWMALVRDGGYDLIIADRLLARAVPGYAGAWWDLPHFALSGRLQS